MKNIRALVVMMPMVAFASECHIIVSSTKLRDGAEQLVKKYQKDGMNATILRTNNGLYRISVAKVKGSEAKAVMQKLQAEHKIPNDAYCSAEAIHIDQTFWQLPSVPTTAEFHRFVDRLKPKLSDYSASKASLLLHYDNFVNDYQKLHSSLQKERQLLLEIKRLQEQLHRARAQTSQARASFKHSSTMVQQQSAKATTTFIEMFRLFIQHQQSLQTTDPKPLAIIEQQLEKERDELIEQTEKVGEIIKLIEQNIINDAP